ncbi:MAG: efflux transporter outer membrane subunit [Planctomycetota bacterium]
MKYATQSLATTVLCLILCGCSNLQYWWRNDHRVGPNYGRPAANVADDYLDATSSSTALLVQSDRSIEPEWWHTFQDPALDQLIQCAYSQNLSLKTAAWRIQEARAIRRIAAANLLPQSQTAFGQYAHTQNSQTAGNAFPGFPVTIDDWSLGFDVGWELDLWGRIRRSIEASDAQLQSSVHDYEFAIVTLIGDVASLYIQIRSIDERLELAKENVALQSGSLEVAQIRFREGRTSKLDVVQAEGNLALTKSLIPSLELARRQSLNALAVLLGMPPAEIQNTGLAFVQPGRLPQIPNEVVVGIPAELLRRRPDIRSAERLMAAQFEQIGIAEADLYPTMTIGGTLGLQSAQLSRLFDGRSFTGTIAPAFRWNILNYGRLRQAIRVEEARFQQIQWDFQNAVLNAQREVEDGIAEFIKVKEQLESVEDQVAANQEAVELAISLYKEGQQDFGRVFVVESGLVQSQDQLVALRANVALALIKTYKSLGGGWEVRCTGGPQAFGDLAAAVTDPVAEIPVSNDISVVELESTLLDLPLPSTPILEAPALESSEIAPSE